MLTESHNRSGRTLIAGCDGCRSETDGDTGSYPRMREHLKARGWQTFPKLPLKPGKPIWLHACPSCARERAHDISVARNALRHRTEQQGTAA